MFAYVPFGTGQPTTFKAPIRLDMRGRKFTVNPVQFEVAVKPEEPQGRVWEIKGSKGDVYRVTEVGGTMNCTCSGFRFRGDCKHVKSVK
jgi:hypothetical protein